MTFSDIKTAVKDLCLLTSTDADTGGGGATMLPGSRIKRYIMEGVI